MIELISALKSLGLSDLAAKIYLAGLSLGPTSVEQLAKKSGVKRTSIYGLLEELKKTGLISVVKSGRKNNYIMESPQQLLRVSENALENLKTILPDLQALWHSTPDKPQVTFLEGKVNLIKLVEEIESTGGDFAHISGSTFSTLKLFGHGKTEEYIKRKDIRGQKRRVLVTKEPWVYDFIKKNPSPLREYGFLPPDTNIPVEIYLYGRRYCAFMVVEPRPIVLIINNETIYKMQMMMFEALWQNAEKI